MSASFSPLFMALKTVQYDCMTYIPHVEQVDPTAERWKREGSLDIRR